MSKRLVYMEMHRRNRQTEVEALKASTNPLLINSTVQQ